jgi:hypothetical protein
MREEIKMVISFSAGALFGLFVSLYATKVSAEEVLEYYEVKKITVQCTRHDWTFEDNNGIQKEWCYYSCDGHKEPIIPNDCHDVPQDLTK